MFGFSRFTFWVEGGTPTSSDSVIGLVNIGVCGGGAGAGAPIKFSYVPILVLEVRIIIKHLPEIFLPSS